MKLKDFNYHLPESLIAQYPLARRDQARLMVIDRKSKTIRHDVFANVGRYLPAKSMVVLNDSKVISARLLGKKERSGGQVEIFLLKRMPDGRSFEVLMRPAKRIKEGDTLIFNNGHVQAQVINKQDRIVRFENKNVMNRLEHIGHIPLPPYINRQDEAVDRKYYQTVFAKKWGSVASPTAGLHFTKPLLKRLTKAGHKIEKITLHINYGTFKPVEERDITQHQMHCEDYAVTKKTQQSLQNAKEKGSPIVAVGTTSCRVLETIAENKKLKGSTDIFIYPGFSFQVADILITNFHLPHSTLLMLVYAFGSSALIKKAYKEAIGKKYRFYSYGDAMMIL